MWNNAAHKWMNGAIFNATVCTFHAFSFTVFIVRRLRLLPKKGFQHAERDCLRSEVSS